ncbi:MAG TPA: VanZ family protein [Hymenobacter sp.]|jgi:glycopeptide antibiotics resistance protein|uniref:VanZ family protein n=1 Tax=Hymenobacter sp. TaxID=1898978 RepID=UPI002ED863C5
MLYSPSSSIIENRRFQLAFRAALWMAAVVYVALLLYIVFFARRRAGLHWSPGLVNLKPLITTIRRRHYMEAIGPVNYWTNIFGNIALFVPLPLLVAALSPLRNRWALLGIGVGLSISIEVIQYVWRIGVPDIDDVIMNSTGTLLGVLLWEYGLRRLYDRLTH